MNFNNEITITMLIFHFIARCSCGLLGAGNQYLFNANFRKTCLGFGDGSCRAPPFRSESVQWLDGCPDFAPCCSEYGYCHTRAMIFLVTIGWQNLNLLSHPNATLAPHNQGKQGPVVKI